jgi:hypothetical protein
MRNCASGNPEIPGSLAPLAPRNDGASKKTRALNSPIENDSPRKKGRLSKQAAQV